jgi:DNA gyrase subunit B
LRTAPRPTRALPLYKRKWQRSAEEFEYSDRERDGLLAAGLATDKKINQDGGVQRYKGLGEMDAKELWETTMNPSSRLLRQVTVDDTAAAEAMLSLLMDEDVEARRQFITRKALDVQLLDV